MIVLAMWIIILISPIALMSVYWCLKKETEKANTAFAVCDCAILIAFLLMIAWFYF